MSFEEFSKVFGTGMLMRVQQSQAEALRHVISKKASYDEKASARTLSPGLTHSAYAPIRVVNSTRSPWGALIQRQRGREGSLTPAVHCVCV